MKILLSISFTLIGFISIAQNTTRLFSFVDINYYNISDNTESSGFEYQFQHQLGLGVGLNILKKRRTFGFRTELGYNNLKYSLRNTRYAFYQNDPGVPEYMNYEKNFTYLYLGGIARFQIDKKRDFRLGLGLLPKYEFLPNATALSLGARTSAGLYFDDPFFKNLDFQYFIEMQLAINAISEYLPSYKGPVPEYFWGLKLGMVF